MNSSRIVFVALAACFLGSAYGAQTELTGVAQLSARGDHACVVTAGGGAKCWGLNHRGQLGSPSGGANDYRTAATDVVGLTSGVVAIAAATGPHTCAIVTGGGVTCWGSNSSGQLGDGTQLDRSTPVDVQGLPWPAVALAGGAAHTCALSADGAVACWGGNSEGQIGDGTTTTPRLTATPVSGLSSGIVAISAANFHTCGVTSAGALKCWGSNIGGQLGDGTNTTRLAPVDSLLTSGVTAVATGGDTGSTFHSAQHRTCAIASGVTKCWGSNGEFISGNPAPTDVPGVGTGALAITIGGGRIFTGILSGSFPIAQYCVVSSTGGARCWGTNYCGIVGDGTPPACGLSFPEVPPAADVVDLPAGVVSISAAAFFTCALVADGGVDCWGAGYGSRPVAATEGTTPQSIYFGTQYPFVPVGGTSVISVSDGGGSGNPVVLSSLTPGTCSVIAPRMVMGLAAGACTIGANQAGNPYYDPAPQTTLTFAIDPHSTQTITFDQVPALFVGGVGVISATASSGLPVSFTVTSGLGSRCSISGNVLKGLTEGIGCTVRADQPGNAEYLPATASMNITVAANAGAYGLVVATWGGGTGTVTSSPAGIDCGTACAANFAAGSTVTLSANVPAGSVFDGWGGACSGTGACTVAMDALKTVTARFDSDTPRLSSLSTRGMVLYGNGPLVAGFVVGGSGHKTVLVRARGVSLQPFISSIALFDPKIQIVRSSDQAILAANDNWVDQQDAEAIRTLGFGLTVNIESALLVTLPPGAYTALLMPNFGNPGVGIVEVFEIDRAERPLEGLSTRGQVASGDQVMIAGFVIEGRGPQTVVVRGRGPSLAAFGVTDAIPDPSLQLVRSSDQALVAANENWRDAANADAIMSSGFAPSDDREAAILVTLEPGAYTAILRGAPGNSGTAIVEVYRVGN